MPLSVARRAELRSVLLLAALALATGLLGLGNHGLWNPDEPRDAGIGREMWETGSWVVARLTGLPFLEKPPLYWWLQGALFSLRGVDISSARLASALFGLGTVASTYLLGRRFFSREAATLGGLLLLTTSTFAGHSHTASIDPALLFSMTGALACFAHAEPAQGTRRVALLIGMDAFLAAGFFSKGLLGVGLPVLSMLTYLLCAGRLRGFLVPLAGAAAVVCALAGAWLWEVHRELGPSAVREFLIDNHLERLLPHLATKAVGHRGPFYYYALKAPRDFLPWWPLALLALAGARREWPRLAREEREGLTLLLCTLVPTFLVFSIAGTKRAVYLLPLAPAVVLLAGWGLAAELARPRWQERVEMLSRRGALCAAAAAPGFVACFGASTLLWGASLALAGLGVLSERARDAASERWVRALALTAVAWACLLVAGPPLLDAERSLETAARELDAALPRAAPLRVVSPSESLRGIAAFYLERPVSVVFDPSQLNQLDAESIAWIVVESEGTRDAAFEVLRGTALSYRVVHERTELPARFWVLAVGPPDLLAQRFATLPYLARSGSSGHSGRTTSSVAATSTVSSGWMRLYASAIRLAAPAQSCAAAYASETVRSCVAGAGFPSACCQAL